MPKTAKAKDEETAKKKSLEQQDKFMGQDGGDVKVAVSLRKRLVAAPIRPHGLAIRPCATV